MGDVIGALVPLALGIAVSPVPVGAVVLILLSPRPKGASVAFLLGWILGIVVAVSVFALLSGLIPAQDPGAAHPIAGAIMIVLGVVLLLVGIRLWRRRPRDGAAPKAPGWMRSMSSLTVVKAGLLGFGLAALNPVDTLISVFAGVLIGTSGLGPGEIVVGVAVFTLVGACTVAGPVIAYLVAPLRINPRLRSLHEWLVRYNATVTVVVVIVVATAMIGKGIGNL